MSIQHSNASSGWGTPPEIIALVRQVLDSIDLDPASSAAANLVVGAKRYYTATDDGIYRPWSGSVFCNPPSGRVGRRSLPLLFWDRLCESIDEGYVTHGIFLAYSIEQLQTSQSCVCPMLQFAVCVPSKRIRFLDPSGMLRTSPTHASAIVYVPGTKDATATFCRVFRAIGQIT